eukprot:gnl/TRDRNA2_/TRDRNA2_91151_c0_seq1.p1 gnl/TRDRNA2_/TRDRNA2_91151_c0~~gnl/TRDRNA2_/TRDRNA2_91151_c0_seq1.p1  ORF type:complete len:331 (+),score=35.57 gnl/TRDRNA2_/TRDRNA2_91151_c0_seq1:30-995(+)
MAEGELSYVSFESGASSEQNGSQQGDDLDPMRNASPQRVLEEMRQIQEVHERLGGGDSTQVYRCTLHGLEGQVAVKLLMRKQKLDSESREVQLHAGLRHPNLLELVMVIPGPPTAIVVELAPGGNMQELLHERRRGRPPYGRFGYGQRLQAALDVALATEYLHSQNIVHRAVTVKNCFLSLALSDDASTLPTVKLGDLGRARIVQSDVMTKGVGYIRSMAPEVLQTDSYSVSADIFSFSMLLWELMTGKIPFSNSRNWAHLTQAIVGGQRPAVEDFDSIPGGPQLIDILEDCWAADEHARITAYQLVQRLMIAQAACPAQG